MTKKKNKKKNKEQTTTITLTMRQYNELEGVISNAHFGGYYYRLKDEQPQAPQALKVESSQEAHLVVRLHICVVT